MDHIFLHWLNFEGRHKKEIRFYCGPKYNLKYTNEWNDVRNDCVSSILQVKKRDTQNPTDKIRFYKIKCGGKNIINKLW